MIRKVMAVILSLVLEVNLCGEVFAKSGQEHIQLWDDVFGISDSASRNNILPLWKTAQEVPGFAGKIRLVHMGESWP